MIIKYHKDVFNVGETVYWNDTDRSILETSGFSFDKPFTVKHADDVDKMVLVNPFNKSKSSRLVTGHPQILTVTQYYDNTENCLEGLSGLLFTKDSNVLKKPTLDDYYAVRKKFFTEKTDQRFGQYICNQLNITDPTIFYNTSISEVDRRVLKHLDTTTNQKICNIAGNFIQCIDNKGAPELTVGNSYLV